MKLLTFLTRKQAWLSPLEMSRSFRLNGDPVSVRTLHRWLAFLREEGSLVYYPYPRADRLGLQDVLVRIRDLRTPDILRILPFGASFGAEAGLADGQPLVSQGYWVPGFAMEGFREFWSAAQELGHVGGFQVFRSRNTHFIFSPFEETISEDGTAELGERADNDYFAALIRRNLRQRYEVRLGESLAQSPILIPLVLEHIWEHFSSRQLWQAIRSRGERHLLPYARGKYAKALKKYGSALRLLQRHWRELMRDFDRTFLQPRVFFAWPSVRRSLFVSLMLNAGSTDKMIQAAVRASERSIVTSLRPEVEPGGWCHISCFLPSDELLPVLHVVRDHHRGSEAPLVAIQDKRATLALFQPSFCKVDWRLFDPADLEWTFHTERYLEALKGTPAGRPSDLGDTQGP